ncbi:MAG: translation initiation factor [Planctomycetes bacterium]|nr:translation initiation factor [Planctomycetota bacterium]
MGSGRREKGDGWTFVRACPACRRPMPECSCRKGGGSAPREGPTIRLRLERRNGKPVTVLAASGIDPAALDALIKDLKSAFAAGGTRKGLEGEIQGDHREKLRERLRERGIRVKG